MSSAPLNPAQVIFTLAFASLTCLALTSCEKQQAPPPGPTEPVAVTPQSAPQSEEQLGVVLHVLPPFEEDDAVASLLGEQAEEWDKSDLDERRMTLGRFRELEPEKLAEWWLLMRLKDAYRDQGVDADLPTPLTLSLKDMGWDGVQVSHTVYTGVSTLSQSILNVFMSAYSGQDQPSECVDRYGRPSGWNIYGERCRRFLYDTLVEMKYGRPLYEELGRLDAKTMALILADLDTLSQQDELIGAPAKQVYAVMAPALNDYLEVWAGMEKRGLEALRKEYKVLLERHGMTEEAGPKDSSILEDYDKILKSLEIDALRNPYYGHTIVGFWLRRIDDGTAQVLVSSMERAQDRLSGRKSR